MRNKLIEVRDYFYDRMKDLEKEYGSTDQYEMGEIRTTINTLNTEIHLVETKEAELARKKLVMDTCNSMPIGYRVIDESMETPPKKIIVEMDMMYMHKDCADDIIYKGRKYVFGELIPQSGCRLRREYNLPNGAR